MRYSVDFEIVKIGEFEPENSFTRDYQTKEEILKLLKEFPPYRGIKRIRETFMDWTSKKDDYQIDIFVYDPMEEF